MSRTAAEELDVVVIGAGWYGLSAAKQYRSQHAGDTIAILDSASSIGGVWAKSRQYEGMKSNNLKGTYEYPDFPMDPETFGVHPGQHVPGDAVQRYQEAYARHFGLLDRVRLNTKVITAEHKPEGGWILRTQTTDPAAEDVVKDSEISEIVANRLIMATGKVSEPFLPQIQGQETFGKPIFHAKYFGQHVAKVDQSSRVTIFGGTKFAWDAAYAYGRKGVKVDWVIRESGHGPCWMAPPYVTPLNKWLEKLVNTRFVHWFSPCVWGQDSGYHGIKSFWHGNPVGRTVTRSFWNVLSGDALSLMGYDKHPETKKLKPTTDAFHSGCSFSILNYDTDFFELIRNGTISVHVADLSHLSPGKVHLLDAEKTALDSDALLCVTGWKHAPPMKFLPEGIEARMGLPVDPNGQQALDSLASRTDLLSQVDQEIQQRFPVLTQHAKFNPNYVALTDTKAFSLADGEKDAPTQPHTAMMLYRFMVPASPEFLRTKDLAFAGAIMNFSNIICSHVQGLWISAYFDGKLVRDPSTAVLNTSSPASSSADPDDKVGDENKVNADQGCMSLEQVQYQTVLHNRFGKWRYPNDPGAKSPDFVFEAVPYLDMMMADLGLPVHRKNGWFQEMTDPYGPEDYCNINQQWEDKFAAAAAAAVKS